MPNFSILLPPSEITQPGGNPFAPDMFDYRTSNTFNYFNELNSDRRKLIAAVQGKIEEGEGLEEMLGVMGAELEETLEIDSEIYDAPLMSALDRFSPGVMYDAMDFPGLPTGAQRRLLENGIIFSGLFGLLRPDDLIPDHRLPMDAVVPGIGKLSDFWRPLISPVLNEELEEAFVWNFLPASLLDAWENERPYDRIIRVSFYEQKNGTRTPVADGLPTLEGKLVNFIVRESLEDLEPLLEWTHPDGYQFDPDATEEDEAEKAIDLVLVKGADLQREPEE
jgi:hypothetical protein